MDTSLRRQAERILKGAANHRRIQILLLIQEKRCLSLFAIQDLTDLSPTYRKTLRTEQLSGSTSNQNILESTFSVETQKICGVGSGLVGD